MKGQDFEFEEFVIPEAIGLPFHGFDLIVGPFQGSGGDGVVIIGQDAAAVKGQGLGHLDQHGDAGSRGPIHPILQDGGRCGFVRLLSYLVQVFLHIVGQGQRLVQF